MNYVFGRKVLVNIPKESLATGFDTGHIKPDGSLRQTLGGCTSGRFVRLRLCSNQNVDFGGAASPCDRGNMGGSRGAPEVNSSDVSE